MKRFLRWPYHCIMNLLRWLFIFPLLILICRLLLRFIPKKFDIGMGPLPLISYVHWAKALRKKGYTVETFVSTTYFITSDFDKIFNIGWRKIFIYFPELFFIRTAALYRCVYLHFNGGPLAIVPGMRLAEPLLFKLAGVKIVVMPYGSDSQILDKTPNKVFVNAICNDYPAHYKANHGKLQRQVAAWSRRADIVIGSMDSIDYLHFWNRVRHCHFAIDTDALTPAYPNPLPGQPVKILHAPNHKACKGSEFVFKAIEKLKSEGYEIELIFKQNVPNHEFIEIIREADIVIDQLIIGWYAFFAMEAMSLGKPVICYLRPDLVKTYEDIGCIEPGEIPLISAEPSDITDVLRSLLDAPDTFQGLGQKSRRYVEKYHSLDAVGEFFDEINKSLGLKPKTGG